MKNNNALFKILFVIAILAVGIVYSALPHFVRYEALKNQGLRYIPLTIESTFDHLNIHAARYRDVVDGTLFPNEMDTYEYKGGPILWPILTPFIMSPFFLPFDSVFPGIIMTDFLFPALLFVALFSLLHALTQNRWFALFSAYTVLLFPQLPVLIPPSSFAELKMLFFQFVPFSGVSTSELNFLARDSYIPSGPFFVLMFYFVYCALSTEARKNLFIILGGVFYGLLFYLYFYFWVFATIFLGILFLVFLCTKNYSAARIIFLTSCVGVAVSIPFWINQYTLTQLPSYKDIISRMGIEEGHAIRWFLWKTYLLQIAMAAFAIYFGHIFSKKTLGIFLAALAVTGIVAYNINVVTGWSVQSDHWGNKIFLITNGIIWPPLVYYAWLFVIPLLKRNEVYVKKLLSVLAILVVTTLTAHVIESTIKENTKHALAYTVSAPSMDAYEWLTKNTPKDSVIMTPSIETNIEIVAYTHNRIFQARSQNNLLSKNEVLDRLYTTQKFFGVSSEKFFETISSSLGVFNFFTAEYNSRALDSALRAYKYPVYQLSPDVARIFLNNYTNFKIPDEIPYRLDFIFIGSREREMGIGQQVLGQYKRLYDMNGVTIYEYKSK